MKLTMRRLIAYVIDICILFIVLAPLGFVVQRWLGTSPQTGPEIWVTLIFNFSIPCWVYFIVSDLSVGGSTIGKRIMGIRTIADTGSISVIQAIGRTAIKLLPWELTHISMFALSSQLGTFTLTQVVVLTIMYALLGIYILTMLLTRGTRSIHDLIVSSSVS